MNWFQTIEPKDWIIVLSTLSSPLAAVQITKYIERRQQSRDEQLKIFKTLMATRATNLNSQHVESLNMIDIVFSGKSKGETEIRRLWKQYLDHLCERSYSPDAWENKRKDLFVELMHAMAVYLRFDFDKTHIKNQSYFPSGYGQLESDQTAIRKTLMEILSGQRPLSMWIANFPQASPQDSQDSSKS